MIGIPREKIILKKVIANLKSEKDVYCRIKHRKGWFRFLQDGDLTFTPSKLHQVLRQVINSEGMEPKGGKLFCLEKHYNFTIKIDKTPYTPEAALERFIVASNPDNIFDQIAIGGRRESIDIGIKENDSQFIFIELKPWSSTTSPLYAIVENLKNLIEFRIIQEKKIKDTQDIQNVREVDLIILAPLCYYQDYGLIDSTGLLRRDEANVLKKTLNNLSSEFATNISLMALQIKKSDFYDKCKKFCEKRNIEKQQPIYISNADIIPALERAQWELLISSDKKN